MANQLLSALAGAYLGARARIGYPRSRTSVKGRGLKGKGLQAVVCASFRMPCMSEILEHSGTVLLGLPFQGEWTFLHS